MDVSKIALLAVAASTFAMLANFENCADLYFFGGIRVFFWLWTLTQHRERQVAILPCTEMKTVFTSQSPILFKQCIPQNISTVRDLVYFSDKQQNLFSSCGTEKKLRYFEFQAADGANKSIIEDVPCANSTLQKKVERFDQHNASAENSYFEVHTYMMDKNEREEVLQDFHTRNIVPPDLQISQMTTPTLTYFLHAGRSAVYYLHAHMDHFLSFCVQEQKTWLLIDPKYFRNFETEWSGNAQVLLKENSPTPRLTVTQERGDVLFIPPWWIHETKVQDGAKNLGFNIHWLSKYQMFGAASWLIADVVGDTSWFYR